MNSDYEEHLHWGTKNLVIAFAGGPQNVYQFGKSLSSLHVDHILMRDSTQRYHHFGVAGIGDQEDVAEYIGLHMTDWRYVITTGVSSGAYAALLYGQIVSVDKVVVFSALTGRQADDLPEKDRWWVEDPSVHPDTDLRQYFKKGIKPEIISYISNGENTYLDAHMSRRIGVEPIVIPGYSHAELARVMRDRGYFKELFT